MEYFFNQLSTASLSRLFRLILKRTIGEYLEDDLLLNQIKINGLDSALVVDALCLNCVYINSKHLSSIGWILTSFQIGSFESKLSISNFFTCGLSFKLDNITITLVKGPIDANSSASASISTLKTTNPTTMNDLTPSSSTALNTGIDFLNEWIESFLHSMNIQLSNIKIIIKGHQQDICLHVSNMTIKSSNQSQFSEELQELWKSIEKSLASSPPLTSSSSSESSITHTAKKIHKIIEIHGVSLRFLPLATHSTPTSTMNTNGYTEIFHFTEVLSIHCKLRSNRLQDLDLLLPKLHVLLDGTQMTPLLLWLLSLNIPTPPPTPTPTTVESKKDTQMMSSTDDSINTPFMPHTAEHLKHILNDEEYQDVLAQFNRVWTEHYKLNPKPSNNDVKHIPEDTIYHNSNSESLSHSFTTTTTRDTPSLVNTMTDSHMFHSTAEKPIQHITDDEQTIVTGPTQHLRCQIQSISIIMTTSSHTYLHLRSDQRAYSEHNTSDPYHPLDSNNDKTYHVIGHNLVLTGTIKSTNVSSTDTIDLGLTIEQLTLFHKCSSALDDNHLLDESSRSDSVFTYVKFNKNELINMIIPPPDIDIQITISKDKPPIKNKNMLRFVTITCNLVPMMISCSYELLHQLYDELSELLLLQTTCESTVALTWTLNCSHLDIFLFSHTHFPLQEISYWNQMLNTWLIQDAESFKSDEYQLYQGGIRISSRNCTMSNSCVSNETIITSDAQNHNFSDTIEMKEGLMCYMSEISMKLCMKLTAENLYESTLLTLCGSSSLTSMHSTDRVCICIDTNTLSDIDMMPLWTSYFSTYTATPTSPSLSISPRIQLIAHHLSIGIQDYYEDLYQLMTSCTSTSQPASLQPQTSTSNITPAILNKLFMYIHFSIQYIQVTFTYEQYHTLTCTAKSLNTRVLLNSMDSKTWLMNVSTTHLKALYCNHSDNDDSDTKKMSLTDTGICLFSNYPLSDVTNMNTIDSSSSLKLFIQADSITQSTKIHLHIQSIVWYVHHILTCLPSFLSYQNKQNEKLSSIGTMNDEMISTSLLDGMNANISNDHTLPFMDKMKSMTYEITLIADKNVVHYQSFKLNSNLLCYFDNISIRACTLAILTQLLVNVGLTHVDCYISHKLIEFLDITTLSQSSLAKVIHMDRCDNIITMDMKAYNKLTSITSHMVQVHSTLHKDVLSLFLDMITAIHLHIQSVFQVKEVTPESIPTDLSFTHPETAIITPAQWMDELTDDSYKPRTGRIVEIVKEDRDDMTEQSTCISAAIEDYYTSDRRALWIANYDDTDSIMKPSLSSPSQHMDNYMSDGLGTWLHPPSSNPIYGYSDYNDDDFLPYDDYDEDNEDEELQSQNDHNNANTRSRIGQDKIHFHFQNEIEMQNLLIDDNYMNNRPISSSSSSSTTVVSTIMDSSASVSHVPYSLQQENHSIHNSHKYTNHLNIGTSNQSSRTNALQQQQRGGQATEEENAAWLIDTKEMEIKTHHVNSVAQSDLEKHTQSHDKPLQKIEIYTDIIIHFYPDNYWTLHNNNNTTTVNQVTVYDTQHGMPHTSSSTLEKSYIEIYGKSIKLSFVEHNRLTTSTEAAGHTEEETSTSVREVTTQDHTIKTTTKTTPTAAAIYSIDISVYDITMLLYRSGSRTRKVLHAMKSSLYPRNISVPFLDFHLDAYENTSILMKKQEEDQSISTVLTINMKLIPMHVYMDNILITMIKSMAESSNTTSASTTSIDPTTQTNIDLSSVDQEHPHIRHDTSSNITSTPIKQFQCSTILIKLTYLPSELDVTKLSQGDYSQLLNIFPLDNAMITLKRIDLYDVANSTILLNTLSEIWCKDIFENQLKTILSSTLPVKGMVHVGQGMMELLHLSPATTSSSTSHSSIHTAAHVSTIGSRHVAMHKYKTRRKVLHDLQKSSGKVLTTIATESLDLSHKMTMLAAKNLTELSRRSSNSSNTATMTTTLKSKHDPISRRSTSSSSSSLSSSSVLSHQNTHTHSKTKSRTTSHAYSNMPQPQGVGEGLNRAYHIISDTLVNTVHLLAQNESSHLSNTTAAATPPSQYYQRSHQSTRAYLQSILRILPQLILEPTAATVEAVSQTMLGIRNSIDPNMRQDEEDIYV